MSKSVKPLSIQDQLTLRKKAKAELERLDALYANEEARIMINDFKEKFSVCEMVYKIILQKYLLNKDGKLLERMQINMKQAPNALLFAGYDYERDLLTKLFGAEEHVGRRSVKKLRDALTHNAASSAVVELKERRKELYGYMDAFLEKIRSFDDKTATSV